MKQRDIVQAYKIITKLYQKQLPLPVAYKLYKLKRQLQPAWDFQTDTEQKLIDEFKPEWQEDGSLKFESPESARAFEAQVTAALGMESDIDITPVTIPLCDGVTISPEDIESLAGIVTFEEA